MTPPRPTPECPRCGYDQSGIIAAWKDACPLTTTCSECGYEFLNRDVLSRRPRPFEHARRSLARSFAFTVLRSLRPWSFWRWLQMEHWIVPGRLALGAAAGAAMVHLIGVALYLLVRVFCYPLTPTWSGSGLGYFWWYQLLLPFGSRHIGWNAAVGWSTLGGLLSRLPITGVAALAMLLLMPASFLVLQQTLRASRVRKAHLLRVMAYSLVGWPIVGVSSHFAVYLIDLIASPAARSYLYWGPPWSWLGPVEYLFVPTMTCAWLVIWWGVASSRYLKLPRPWLTVTILMLVSVLATVLICVLLQLAGLWS